MKYRFLIAALLVFPALQVNGQTLQWEDYSPVSTLEVEKNPVTRAKYRFVDAHAHQWRIGTASVEEIKAMVAEMDAMNLVTMVNLSGGSGEELLQKIQNTEAHAPGR
ncbi:MAG: amidohydrolase, partial [Rhodothermaceae bacterium]|nr:amidohydrolase [Rhodothermaceae bacterium]